MSEVYRGALTRCETHAERLRWAMSTLEPMFPLSAVKISAFTPIDLAVFDQFVVRFSKLQDTMGAALFPAVLDLTQEPGDLAAFIDKLNRLEKIGAIRSASQWLLLREMRNQFAHDYPDDPEIQAGLLNKAFGLAAVMLDVLGEITAFASRYDAPLGGE